MGMGYVKGGSISDSSQRYIQRFAAMLYSAVRHNVYFSGSPQRYGVLDEMDYGNPIIGE